MEQSKPIIYQLFPRLFTNTCDNCTPNGSITDNGVGKMNQIDDTLLHSIKQLGVSHVWYTGVIEHAQATTYPGIEPDNIHVIKGKAGSPYAIKDYYDIDPDIAVDVPNRINEFRALIERTHAAGLKVIIDFVPNHVARRYHSDACPEDVKDFGADDDVTKQFDPNNNFYYINEPFSPHIFLGEGKDKYEECPAKATGNDCFSAHPGVNDWYETVKLNYGVDYFCHQGYFSPVPDTWNKMLQIIEYWANMGVDGFRCDMAFMVPVVFWNWLIPQIKATYPHVIFIAEIYDVNIYGQYLNEGHFDYLYDKVNLYDTLRAVTCGYGSATQITQCWRIVEGLSNRMLNFLENHDEQRIASEQFAGNPRRGIPALIVSSTLSTGPFLIYQGQELGEKADDAEGFSGHDGRTTIFDYWSIPTVRRWYNGGKCDGGKSLQDEKTLREIYTKVLNAAANEQAISHGGFFDLMYVNQHTMNPHKQYCYLRHHNGDLLLIVVNFDDVEADANVIIPAHAFQCIGIEEGEYIGNDLISNSYRDYTLSPDEAISMHIDAKSGVIVKLQKKSKRKISKK